MRLGKHKSILKHLRNHDIIIVGDITI